MATFNPELTRIFGALSDPTRLAVVEELAQGPASVSKLSQPFGMAGPSFLKHVRVLESAGLIRTEKKGRIRTVRLEPDALRWAEDWVALHRAEWERHLDDLGAFLKQGDN
ncbi:MAG TPA: metalloregulator ArsR/SmtB family transcription factor [Roseiarcus sp.]|jgi:DNA-binding transcriptional ArsR family regulator